MPNAACPECDADVELKADAALSDIIECEECGADLEVVGLDPLELEIAADDLDDDDDEDEF